MLFEPLLHTPSKKSDSNHISADLNQDIRKPVNPESRELAIEDAHGFGPWAGRPPRCRNYRVLSECALIQTQTAGTNKRSEVFPLRVLPASRKYS
jgi:hypothetical protein